MPRPGTMAADIRDYLATKPEGAAVQDIVDALALVRRSPVLSHSVRSAIYQHLEGQDSGLFVRIGRGRYGLRR